MAALSKIDGRESLSIIVPVLNEADRIQAHLSALKLWRMQGAQIIVVDGGSVDATVESATPLADRVITAPRGRASQMNAGAQLAAGSWLLFLHADTALPGLTLADWLHSVQQHYQHRNQGWGRFDVRLSGERAVFRMIEFFMNQRSRLTAIATGDQGIFVRREWFNRIGGFPDIELMEDVALSKRLRRLSAPYCLHDRVTTSSRRWEENGVTRTILLMWALRLAYFIGVPPRHLLALYR